MNVLLSASPAALRDAVVFWIAALTDHLPFAWIATGVLSAAVVVALVSGYGALVVYVERKVMAFIQCRLGPMEVGPDFELKVAGRRLLPHGWFGLGVIIADGVKLLGKEDLAPRAADPVLFRLAPYVVFASTVAAFAVIPYGAGFLPAALDGGILFLLAASSLGVTGLVMGGYGSNNKWSLYGALRSVAQVVSYEVPMGLALCSAVLAAGTLDLGEIAAAQAGWFWNWHALQNPWLFLAAIVYFISALAETNRTPFDIPEAESELVAGYHTEYSGMRFAIFMFAEYVNMLLVSLVMTVVFLGGAHSGLAPLDRLPLFGPLFLAAKALLLVVFLIWLRWTLPRYRVDQLMNLCWKALIPVALAAFAGAAAAVFPSGTVYEVLNRLAILLLLLLFGRTVARGLAPMPRRAAEAVR